MAELTLSGVCKTFGSLQVIRDVDLQIEDGEFVVFVGPSGCGKSTLLRCISGLVDITGGTLEIGGQRMNDVPAAKRGVAMVFQSYALYPHLRVRENMGFGLKVRKLSKPEIDRRVEEAARTLKLESLLDRFPRELSGGQRQRVAIGRAIVGNPEVFLFDEPLSNLDAELRVHMRAEIAALHKRLGNTMIYVTHDQIEAMTLADKIVVLRDGQVEQVGSPRDLYYRPANAFVAQFIGSPKMNLFEASGLPADILQTARPSAAAIRAGLRPEDMQVLGAGEGPVSGRVVNNEYTGAGSLLHLDLDGLGRCLALYNGGDSPEEGAEISVGFDTGRLYWFDAQEQNTEVA
ncbi:carbohydrate ABC transporter ATP-binding protein, CUT1 family [Pseudooceanicola antarcticus]|uniref:ABC transporter ATP-binding protein n=1 Tax=Pseudooceanicola antarcticus TaxID=1247613 RepID=A0A285IPF6_9RHOB|nr:ABC transporter ATP-binding protein [Pseudooceanicola antarcticus]PJE31459.1 ABC transporter ATP-binding protein [Pseudooceanicola antarcticus]SNY49900.1 carbohydrate ABC transporter ATP-binding protein, CUT1 family [Pseudooceanicola antarcticus]